MIVGVIPARAGSKGIPHKNVVPLGGHPLVEYTLAATAGAARLDARCVTTDDAAVAERALAWGVEVVNRPARLATDSSAMIDVILHCLAQVERRLASPEAVVLLQPTSPLRGAAQIDAAVRAFRESGRGSLLGVNRVSEHPCECVSPRSGKLKLAVKPPRGASGRQAFPPFFYVNGAIYITSTEMLRSKRRFWDEDATLFEMPRWSSIDIDEPDHLALAEAYLSERPELRLRPPTTRES